MMIVSAKVSGKKVLTGVLVAVGVILLLVFLCSKASGEMPAEPSVTNEAATNEQRLAFLQSFGWEVSETPTQTQEVRIPEEFNDVFTRYNELQQSQGFDLSDYAGKRAKRYVYRLTEHPDGEGVHATLIVYQDRVIAADLSCTEGEGFMRPLLPKTGA